MIQGDYNYINLLDKKLELHKLLPENLKEYFINNNEIIEIKYPVETSPEKIKSINLDKNPVVQGKLTGIKGQYLLLDNENVFNVRKYTGYVVNMNIKSL